MSQDAKNKKWKIEFTNHNSKDFHHNTTNDAKLYQ